MNIAFYVSGSATRLRKVFEKGLDQIIRDIRLVFSDDKSNEDLSALLKNRKIDFYCRDHKELEPTGGSRNLTMSNSLLSLLKEKEIDYCFSFGDHLLVGDILKVYENRIINFHPSVLPLFPGRKAIDQAVAAKSNLLGNTAHFINAGVDEGPIIMQHVQSSTGFSEGNYDNVLDHQLNMLKQIHRWLKEDRLKIEDGKVVIKDAHHTSAYFPSLEI